MNIRRNRVLVLAADEPMLIDLQETLEDWGFDTTTTWDQAEAMQLAGSRQFDLLLVEDHPPEVTASEILRELQCSRLSIPCAILQPRRKKTFDSEYFYSLGASGVISDWNPNDVGRWVQERFAARAATAGSKAG